MSYIRNDIYYCPGCGEFFDDQTDKLVQIPYSDIPADFAVRVMSDRQKQFKTCHAQRRAKKRSRPKNGFSQ